MSRWCRLRLSIDLFQIVEIDKQQVPGAGLVAPKRGYRLVEAGAVDEAGQGIRESEPLMFYLPRVALDGDGAKVRASRGLSERSWQGTDPGNGVDARFCLMPLFHRSNLVVRRDNYRCP